MNIKDYGTWSKEKEQYELSDGYSIEKANWMDFSIYFAVYEVYHTNIWFRKNFDQSRSVMKDCEECFWIKKDGNRIGGVLLEPNYMNCIFLIPPYNEYDLIIGKLKQLLLGWSDKNKKIYLGGAKPDKIKYFLRQGFKVGESRRCMIRPTEEFKVCWNDDYKLVPITEEKLGQISRLFAESFIFSDRKTLEQHIKSVQDYLESTHENNRAREASILVYDKKTDELVGACLISIWEEWPNIYEVAVNPSYQNQGLATNMIKRALSILKKEYPVLRLFVTLGNDAEMAYHKLGFLPGIEWTEMYIPVEG